MRQGIDASYCEEQHPLSTARRTADAVSVEGAMALHRLRPTMATLRNQRPSNQRSSGSIGTGFWRGLSNRNCLWIHSNPWRRSCLPEAVRM